MQKENQEIKIFISSRESNCGECGEELGRKAWITLEKEKGALCLSCADLYHLVFLSSGDAALTRRAKKYSILWAVVLKWSKARKRYERQGLLVGEKALENAEQECLADMEQRTRQRERSAQRRAELDREYIRIFADKVRELFPSCPKGREKKIAQHACLKYSGRIGRSCSAKEFAEEAVNLAVIAHIRHEDTDYDLYLSKGYGRHDARMKVNDEVEDVLIKWEKKK